jgi:hypothetical protein
MLVYSIPISIALAFAGMFLLTGGLHALFRLRLLKTTVHLSLASLLLVAAAALTTLTVAVRGYRAFNHEETVAIVHTFPLGPQRFRTDFQFPDGRRASFTLTGDQLYVDAHVLKWKPIGNIFGLHTLYELDRVAGRYTTLEAERTQPRTVHSLAQEKRLDVFDLRRRYSVLGPLLDAEYGSATFITAEAPGAFEIRVSTSGLLVRPH